MDKTVYKKILVYHAKPAMNTLRASVFQQDNDPKQTALTILSYLNGNLWTGELMNWPPQSPDLNPIENLWSIVDNNVRMRAKYPTNFDQLLNILQEEWSGLDTSLLKKLVGSMPKR